MKIPWVYDWGIALYTAAIHLAAVFHTKARRWVQGRRNWAPELARAMSQSFPDGAKRIWIHCASLGEFEQGRPLIEALRRTYPDARILLSFFSPSGYEIRKEYPLADHVCYLPADTPANAACFLDIVQPELAIFVKYEFWLHTLAGLSGKGVPTLLVSAIFRPGQVFFQWYGRAWLAALHSFRHIFVQDSDSSDLLEAHGIRHCTLAGDTRVDRVIALAAEDRSIPLVEAFVSGAPVWIAGSTWPPDEELIAAWWKAGITENWKMIIAPHQISEASLNRLENALPLPAVRFSKAQAETLAEERILIIDNVGMLSALYRYGRMAYIGGGFGAGIHNILEPMSFGLPVIFGPKYLKFREAVEMVQAGGALSVRNATELKAAFTHFALADGNRTAARAAARYLQQNEGATARIMDYINRTSETVTFQ